MAGIVVADIVVVAGIVVADRILTWQVWQELFTAESRQSDVLLQDLNLDNIFVKSSHDFLLLFIIVRRCTRYLLWPRVR